MKFLCDVHIPIKLSKKIVQLGFESEHVNNILAKWHTDDKDIIKYADQKGFILVSKDQDFRNSFLLNCKPKKLIKINLGNVSNEKLLEIFDKHISDFSKINNENTSFMVEVSSDHFLVVVK